jgi:hypothetical protein
MFIAHHPVGGVEGVGGGGGVGGGVVIPMMFVQ